MPIAGLDNAAKRYRTEVPKGLNLETAEAHRGWFWLTSTHRLMRESTVWLSQIVRVDDDTDLLNADDEETPIRGVRVSDTERQTIREVRYASCCSPVLWGVVLVLIGVVALLPYDLSRHAWPIVAIAAGLWLLFGPLDWPRDRRYGRSEDPFDRM